MTKPLLSILIPSLDKRAGLLTVLLRSLEKQITPDIKDKVEICVSMDNGKKSIGKKRNELTRGANGIYCASIDDDDRISPFYISLLLRGIATEPDCCSLIGTYTRDGRIPKIFKHSIEYDGWYEKANILYRYPNHLNAIRTDIAKQMKYPEINHGEDRAFSQQLQASGLLKKEYKIEQMLYTYDYRTIK